MRTQSSHWGLCDWWLQAEAYSRSRFIHPDGQNFPDRMDFYKDFLRHLLFRLPAERATNLAKFGLATGFFGRLVREPSVSDDVLHANLGGIRVGNPVGLAPGFDKDCSMINTMQGVGFGYLVLGSIFVHPRPGNPKPRLFRDVPNKSIIVSLGGPSKGLDYSLRNLTSSLSNRHVPLIACVAGTSPEELYALQESLEPLVDGVELSVRTRHNKELVAFSTEDVSSIIRRMATRKQKPLFVKLPFYRNPKEREDAFELVDVCIRNGVEGVSVVGSIPISDSRMGIGVGTISGKLAYGDTLRLVRDVYAEAGSKLAIKASGGIFTGEDAYEAIRCGATTVEMYSGLVFEGLSAVKRLNERLLELISRDGYKSIEEARGTQTAEHEHPDKS